MSWRSGRSRNGGPHRPLRGSAGLNYAIVAGEVTDAPRRGHGMRGEAVLLLVIAIPVLYPERPEEIWMSSDWEVEVPDPAAARYRVHELDEGQLVMAAGQISERSLAGNGNRRKVLLAEVVYRQPPDIPGLFVASGSPDHGPESPSASGGRNGEVRLSPPCESPRTSRR